MPWPKPQQLGNLDRAAHSYLSTLKFNCYYCSIITCTCNEQTSGKNQPTVVYETFDSFLYLFVNLIKEFIFPITSLWPLIFCFWQSGIRGSICWIQKHARKQKEYMHERQIKRKDYFIYWRLHFLNNNFDLYYQIILKMLME